MKSNGNGNGHHAVNASESTSAATQPDPFANEFIVFDEEDADAPATEAVSQSARRRRRKRITGAFLLMLFVAGVGFALYFMLGTRRTQIDMRVRDTRTQGEKVQAGRQSPDDVTSQAIAELRSTTSNPDPSFSPTPSVPTNTSRVAPTAPVTVPLESIGGTVQPTTVTGAPVTTEAQVTKGTANTTNDGETTATSRADNASPASRSRRNPERSIRCALPVPSPNAVGSSPQRQTERIQPTSAARSESGVVLPSFGSMLPVRTLGVLYTLRQGSLARFELTRDVRGEGWYMRKGTVLVGVNRGSEYDRAYVALVGFIDPESGRFVKLTGDVLGSDGGAGLRGRRRQVSGGWSRVLSRVGASAVNVAGLMVGGLGRRSIIVSDAYGYRVMNPVSSEISGLISERADRQRGFVEVPAGSQGYVMVTDLPQEVRGIDALGEMSAGDLAEGSDANVTRASTGLSERELADLMSSGSPEQIRAALPRMTPEMRRIAEAVLAESGR